MKLLLIEDSTRLQRSMKKGLELEGFSVDFAGNGKEGLNLALNREYDTIILDLMLPGLDGHTILKALREEQRPTFVLVLTAQDQDRVRSLVLRMGADDYLTKPFSFRELVTKIHHLARRHPKTE